MTPEDSTPDEGKSDTDSIPKEDCERLLQYAGSHVAASGDDLAQELGSLGHAVMRDGLDADQLLSAHARAGLWFDEERDILRIAAHGLTDEQDDLVSAAASIHYTAAQVAKDLGRPRSSHAEHHRERLRWELNELLELLDELEDQEADDE